MACPLCGFRSAWVGAGTEGYLIIDSNLPNLMDKYLELQGNETDSTILINRRVGQMPIAGADRRK